MECVVYSRHMKSDCYSPAEKGKLRCHAYQFTPDHHGAPEADGPALVQDDCFFGGEREGVSSGLVGAR